MPPWTCPKRRQRQRKQSNVHGARDGLQRATFEEVVRRRTVDGCIAVGGLGSFVADHLCVVRLQLDEPWGATEAVAGTGQPFGEGHIDQCI
jgi:hypothetical protein